MKRLRRTIILLAVLLAIVIGMKVYLSRFITVAEVEQANDPYSPSSEETNVKSDRSALTIETENEN